MTQNELKQLQKLHMKKYRDELGLFVAEGDVVIGRNMLQISYDNGSLRITPDDVVDMPPVIGPDSDIVDVLRTFVAEYAEQLALNEADADDDVPVYGKHIKVA